MGLNLRKASLGKLARERKGTSFTRGEGGKYVLVKDVLEDRASIRKNK